MYSNDPIYWQPHKQEPSAWALLAPLLNLLIFCALVYGLGAALYALVTWISG